jgi:hypothetical protein
MPQLGLLPAVVIGSSATVVGGGGAAVGGCSATVGGGAAVCGCGMMVDGGDGETVDLPDAALCSVRHSPVRLDEASGG